MNDHLRVLLIDDSPDDCLLVERELRREFPNLQVEQVTNVEALAQATKKGPFDLVVTDYRLSWTDGLAVLRSAKAHWPECLVIMFTGASSEEVAVEAMKAGVVDCILESPRYLARLLAAVQRALERVQQHHTVQEGETRYRSLFDNVPLGLYRVSPAGQILDANLALVQTLGYPDRASLLAVNAGDLYVDPEERRRELARLAQEGVAQQRAIQLRRRDGTMIWVEDHARVIRDSQGEVLYYEGGLEDVTERKEANARLFEAERRQVEQQTVLLEVDLAITESLGLKETLDRILSGARKIVPVSECSITLVDEPSGDLVVQASTDGETGLHISPAVPSAVGWVVKTKETLTEKDVSTNLIFDQQLVEHYGMKSALVVPIIHNGKAIGALGFADCQSRRVFSHGERMRAQTFASQAAIAIEHARLYEAAQRELAERKRVEEELHIALEKYRVLCESFPLGISITDGHGNIIEANQEAERLLGITRAEHIQRRYDGPEWHIVRPDGTPMPPAEYASVRAMKEQRRIENVEMGIVKGGGEITWLSVTAAPIPLENQGVAIAYGDITARKQAEEALRRYAERLKIIHEIDKAILEVQSPEQIAEATLSHLQHLVPYQRATVTTFDLEAYEATVLAAHVDGETRVGSGERFPVQTMTIEQLRQGEVYMVDVMLALSVRSPVFESLQVEGLRSYINVPLIAQTALIGSLNLGSNSPGAFDPEHRGIAREVADLLAIAIQNAMLFVDVCAGRERLQALSRRLLDVQEAERRRLARELHDEIGQSLTGLKLLLELGSRSPSDAAPNLGEAQALVNALLARVRDMSLDLRPAMLDDLGLLPALLWLFERFATQTKVHVDFRHTGLGRRFSTDIETAGYRIVQECLTNVARHAGVNEVSVKLSSNEEILVLQIEDHGTGFDPGAALAAGHTSGLAGMRERAVLLGGRLTIESAPAAGARVTAELPLRG